jgi:uncharacterized protein YndB with AHSA1/START domain
MHIRILVAAGLCLLPLAAQAELKHSAPDGALIEHRYRLSATPGEAWQALVHPELWWPADHTWSGKSSHLSLSPMAGGCFCEAWPGGSAEHARVVMAAEAKMLRMRGSLGPLQDMAVTGVLTVTLTAAEGGSEAVVTYRLSGDPSHGLDKFVPVVDQVIGLQFGSFARHAGEISDSPGK